MDDKEKYMLLNVVKDEVNKISMEYRHGLRDEMFSVGHGVLPGTDDKVYDKINSQIGIHFDSHGLSKGHPSAQYEQLIYLLENGIDKSKQFHTAPFEVSNELRAGLGSGLGTSGGTCYKEGFAVLVSGYRKSLINDGITFVLINDIFGSDKIINTLKGIYENKYTIGRLSEQVEILKPNT